VFLGDVLTVFTSRMSCGKRSASAAPCCLSAKEWELVSLRCHGARLVSAGQLKVTSDWSSSSEDWMEECFNVFFPMNGDRLACSCIDHQSPIINVHVSILMKVSLPAQLVVVSSCYGSLEGDRHPKGYLIRV
jgi:hypothetical protein